MTILFFDMPPFDAPVRVTTAAGRTFTAQRKFGLFGDDGACWVADPDEAPECWTDGACWASNGAEKPSDPVVRWEALLAELAVGG